MKNEKYKKMIAPVIITVLVIAYFFVYFGLIISVVDNKIIQFILAIIPAGLGITMFHTCIERLKEIKGGESDDLSKY